MHFNFWSLVRTFPFVAFSQLKTNFWHVYSTWHSCVDFFERKMHSSLLLRTHSKRRGISAFFFNFANFSYTCTSWRVCTSILRTRSLTKTQTCKNCQLKVKNMLLSYFNSLRNFSKENIWSFCCFSSVLFFHFLLVSKNGSETGARIKTLSISLPTFIGVANCSSERKTVLKKKIFKRKRCCDLNVTEFAVENWTTTAIGWYSAKNAKFKFLQKPTEHTRCFVCRSEQKLSNSSRLKKNLWIQS